MLVEILGYAASAFVAASLVMVSVLRLRVINLAGALLFVAYGIAISSIPILLTNAFITVVNVYHIARILSTKPSSFRYIEATPHRIEEIREFLSIYRDDIAKHYPGFAIDPAPQALGDDGRVYLAVHNLRLEGLAYVLDARVAVEHLSEDAGALLDEALARPHTGSMSYLGFDYVTARFRDLGLAQNLYDRLEEDLRGHTVACIVHRRNRRTRRFLTGNEFSIVTERSDLLLLARTFTA